MPSLFALSVAELSQYFQSPWAEASVLEKVLKGAIIVGGMVVGAFVVGFLVRCATMLVWRDLSSAALFRFRLLGGLAGAGTAYYCLCMWWGAGGSGPGGFGPGLGGQAGKGPGDGKGNLVSKGQNDPSNQTDETPIDSDQILKVRLINDKIKAGALADGVPFAFEDAPTVAVSVDDIVKKAKGLKEKGKLSMVELNVYKDSYELSVTSEFADLDDPKKYLIQPVKDLLAKVVQEAKVPFRYPIPQFVRKEPFGSKKVTEKPS
jgi:hypothetical protein